MGWAIEKINLNDSFFPPLLREMPKPPEKIFKKGGAFFNSKPTIAIVGTRKSSKEGMSFAMSLAKALAERGFMIISGLALGIDGAAHEGALRGNGLTFGVLANGLDYVYPAQHESLAQKMLETGGGLISEYEVGSPPLPHQFLERNRIIAGLSIATVVIEAPIRSGAIVTAKHALEAGREVFVAPGAPYNKNYAGSNMLIRQGARLIGGADDLLEDLETLSGQYPALDFSSSIMASGQNLYFDDEIQKNIFDIIQGASDGLGIDRITETIKLEPRVVSQALSCLLIAEKINEVGGAFFVNQ